MIQVFEATAYDKNAKDVSFETYLVSGLDDTDNSAWINDQLRPYDIYDDEVHMYFAEGELDDRVFKDTEEFFYLIGDEVIKNGN